VTTLTIEQPYSAAMSQITNTHQEYDVAAYSRRVGVTVVAATAVLTLMVRTHGTDSGSSWNPGLTGAGLSLFSWGHLILVALLLGAGLTLLLATTPTVAVVAAAVGLVPAAQLAGAGVVAARHWHPAAGISGPGLWTNQPMLVGLAFAGALAAAVAGLAMLGLLAANRRDLPTFSAVSIAGRASIVIGVLVAILLPIALSIGDRDAHDLTSLGAFALLWSLPWGGALALTAWLPRAAAVATGLTVAVSAASAYPNYELVRVEHHWVAVLTAVACGLLVAGLRWAPDTLAGRRAEPQ
jgi:hypothetical protein